MSTPAQVCGYEWKALLLEVRVSKCEIRKLLLEFLKRPSDLNAIMQVVLKLGDLDDLVSRLEEIGRNTK